MRLSPSRRLFGTLLAQTARQWRRAVDRELQPHGLTEATWLPLLHVSRSEEPMHQKDLAASLSLDRSSVVRLLDNLETLGLLERREGGDRRSKAVHLTVAGEQLVEKVEGIAQDVRERALMGLGEEDIETVLEILKKVCAALSATDKDDDK